jgi:probable HAF family extracellular repeat protein
MHYRIGSLAGITLLLLATLSGTAHAQRYTVTDLGTLGGLSSFANGINNAGQVVGKADLPGTPASTPTHAFLYSGGIMQDLGTLGGNLSNATAINNAGQIVGNSLTITRVGQVSHAFLYSGGIMQDLGTLAGPSGVAQESTANGINDLGQIVGQSTSSDFGLNHAFLYTGGIMTDLGSLIVTQGASSATGINDTGQIVGQSTIVAGSGGGNMHAFVDTVGGSMQDLGTLGGNSSFANAINAAGQIAGDSNTAGVNGAGPQHVILASASGGPLVDLGAFNGSSTCFALGINAAGDIVGSAQSAVLGSAFLYHNGAFLNLENLIDTPGWVLDSATGINDKGQIVGDGTITVNGIAQQHAFLLNPEGVSASAPEPGTLGLLAAGLLLPGCMTLVRRSRNQTQG